MKKLALGFIKFYKKTEFFHLPLFRAIFLSNSICRFTPTCADYTYQAIDKYGVAKGSFLGLKRIIRCHPWSKGGYDPVK